MSETDTAQVRSLWGEGWHRIRQRRLAMLCLAVIGAYGAIGVLDFVPVGWHVGQGKSATSFQGSLLDWLFYVGVGPTDKEQTYMPPGTGRHLLGTDLQGRDVLLLTLKGIRTAMVLGMLTAAIYIPLGLLFGVVAGYSGGVVDDGVVYFYSTLACIPGILLLVALMTLMGKGVLQLSLALGVTRWVGLCRLTRGETLKLREADYVLASRALGAGSGRIILRHIVPNVFHLVIITFTLGFSGIVMSEAVLTYLGVGVQADTASWGMMIQNARMELSRDPTVWWPLTCGAGALFILVLAFNVFGDALRDALDPRLRAGTMKE